MWREYEDLIILSSVRKFGTQWPLIAKELPTRTPDAVRNRWHRLQQTHLLTDAMHQKRVREAAGALLLASGWPGLPDDITLETKPTTEKASTCIKGSDHGRAMWTPEEDALIEEGVRRYGCRWRQIAAALPGRSDSSVRNRWMRMLKDKEHAKAHTDGLQQDQSTAAEDQDGTLSSTRSLAYLPPNEMLAARIADAQPPSAKLESSSDESAMTEAVAEHVDHQHAARPVLPLGPIS